MITQILSFILGTNNARQLRKFNSTVATINALEPSMQALSDEELSKKTQEFRQLLSEGKTLDDILPEAFAVVRETARRTLGQRHFDVQLIGGIVLHRGMIAEMKTGEGKTLTSTLPIYLNALTGKGVHVVTVNDYLARRDAAWMGPIFDRLGLTVGVIQNGMSDHDRKQAYACDIVYGTNNELGFDYLRDNMKFRIEDYVQRELAYAIVDEVDSILIDEARTPLIISGSADKSSDLYDKVNRIIPRLKKGTDYDVDEKARTVLLTESGIDTVEDALHIQNLYDLQNLNLLHHVNQALRAHVLFKKDVDYVVKDDQVLIVDEFTGRILPGRRYSDGLHQALEAKEGVKIEQESQTLASITLQNYFRLYKKLAGMTGTALTEAEEFHKIYGLDVITIPTNKAMIRADKPDLIFLTKNAKYQAIVKDIQECYQKGQPVLIGTIAIETSELLSDILTTNGIPHEVLNAKQHQREAEIIAHAGEPKRVTIATNMAGRGTDIKLTEESKLAGGLAIRGTERHESRRIDNQLRGRSGRQGDPGDSRFYLSLEDDLIRIFAGESIKNNMKRVGMKEDEHIESRLISKTIERSQERVEKHNFEIRKHLLEYDDVLNQQRIVIYRYRWSILEGSMAIGSFIRDTITGTVQDLITEFFPKGHMTEENVKKIMNIIHALTGIDKSALDAQNFNTKNSALLEQQLTDFLLLNYDLYRHQKNSEMIQEAEKWLMLETIDQAWKQHMLNLDHLKEGIGLRGWGQKNPLIEYKREAFDMFQDMMKQIKFDVVHRIFHLNIERFNQQELEQKREEELAQLNLVSAVQTADPAQSAQSKQAHPHSQAGRNDPCPCQSGKKYKKCCMK